MPNLFSSPREGACAAAADDALLRLAGSVALGGMLVLAWRACHATHRRRRDGRPTRAPAAVHTWEGEGGRPLPVDHEAGAAAAVPR